MISKNKKIIIKKKKKKKKDGEQNQLPKGTATLPPCLPVSPHDRAKALSLSPLLWYSNSHQMTLICFDHGMLVEAQRHPKPMFTF